MALLCQPGAEPIAGYQLVQRLGTGGYGEVWKTTAPGGLTKAIKIVYGHKRDARAEQELKALGRIKEVRHPFILSLERFEIIDNQLVILMELADRSLLERFEECKRSGLPGIPRDELLAYLLDASDALDYMGEQYGLQHLDIKPQNLLLVGGRIKLADFGLVKDLEGSSASATGGITPIYATPEAFDGRVSRYSDQYSLAIVYQEMLTGCRPFPGTTALQLASQHTKCPPLLDSLSMGDRPIVGRALSKIPEQRFPTCGEMVQNLLGAGNARPRPAKPKTEPALPLRVRQPPVVVPKALDPIADSVNDLSGLTLPRARRSARPGEGHTEENLGPKPFGWDITPAIAGGAKLRPTLFLGVGGIAGWTLRRLRRRLHRRFGSLAAVPVIRLLLVDTDRTAFQRAEPEDVGAVLDSAETLLLPLRRPEHYRDQSRELLRWLDRRWLYNIPRSLLTEGARPLGRLALIDNASDILSRLRETIGGLTSVSAKTATAQATGLELRDPNPQIFVVASIAGGTGGGMLLTLAYAVQQILAEFHFPADSLRGILVQATSQRRSEAELARLNAFATLSELQHFSCSCSDYPGDPEHGLNPFRRDLSPFRDTYIVHLGDQLDRASAEAATDPLADYLYTSAATEVGAFLDQWRQQTHAAAYGQENDCRLRLFGLQRLSFPRIPLATLAADLFCKHLIDRWSGQPSSWEQKRTDKEARVQIPAVGLDAETLASQLQAATLAVFGEDPEQSFHKMLADFSFEQSSASAQSSPVSLVNEALAKIDIFLGPGAGPRGGRSPVVTPVDLELSNQAKALALQLERSLIEWLLTLVEEPDRRLQAAYYAGQWSLRHLGAASTALGGQLAQMRDHRALLRRRYAAGDFGNKRSRVHWLRSQRGVRSGSSLKQKLIAFCWLRLHESILEKIMDVFDAVSARLTAFLRELEKGSESLRRFGETLVPMACPSRVGTEAPLVLPNFTELLPGQSKTLTDAARHVLRRVEPNLSQPFEKALQAEVLNGHGGLWGLALGSGEPVQRVKHEIQRRALTALLEATRDLDAAQIFLEGRRERDHALRDLLACVASVSPNQEIPKGWQHLVVALPKSPAGLELRELLAPALAEVPNTVLDSECDIVLCHEVAHLPLQQMAEILIGDEAPFAESACHMLTRTDIPWSPLSLGKTASMG